MPPTFHVPAHPGSTGEAVSRRMSTLKRKDNDAELAVRRLLHGAGYRYRVHYPVPGLPRRTMDIAFTRTKVAVFIDGCFWHGCPQHGTDPRSNKDWWTAKLLANSARDADTTRHLETASWVVIRAWEHEDSRTAAGRIAEVLEARAGAVGFSTADPDGRRQGPPRLNDLLSPPRALHLGHG